VTILINALLAVAGVYLLVGLAFAVPFVVTGVRRLDAAAHGATWGFRVIIMPGVAAFWPWLAWRWWRGGTHPEHNAHRDRAGEDVAREVT
jgi:hypothetical protein